MIKFISHKNIDKVKWDATMALARNELIYAYSWYLDIVSPGWGALVAHDYDYIMPLPQKKKFGIHYIFPPYYTQQLGIFSKNPLDENIFNEFINAIPKKFRLTEYNFNEWNTKEISLHDGKLNNNYVVDISAGYDSVRKYYSRNCKRNISKAQSSGLYIKELREPKVFVDFVKTHLDEHISGITNKEWEILHLLLRTSLDNDTGEINAVYTPGNELCAAGSFLLSASRDIFSVCASSREGKQNQAMHMLVDHHIRAYAGKKQLLDFSGSNLKGVAYFNRGFGAEKRNYLFYKINRLPVLIRLFR